MDLDLGHQRAEAHSLLDRVPADQMTAAVRFLEFLLLDPLNRTLETAANEDEEIADEENLAVAGAQNWFRKNEGNSLDQVAAELGLSIEQIREHEPENPVL